jgi:hypothetical protein
MGSTEEIKILEAGNMPHSVISSSQNNRLLRKLQIASGGADTPVPDTDDDEKEDTVMAIKDDDLETQ